jgi:CRP-like cAMP-binding protein
MDFSPLRHAIESLGPMPEPDWALVLPLITTRKVLAGQHLLRAGERAKQGCFVRRGLLREYYTDQNGGEATRRFCQAGELSGSLADLLSGRPALCSIEALEPGEIWSIDWRRCDALSERSSAWMLFLRRLAEDLYLRKTEREFEMLTLPAAERYRRFLAAFPTLEAKLPRALVASYLGITPVHLSRIRAAGKSRRRAAGQQRRK